jgi:hypothetical protein
VKFLSKSFSQNRDAVHDPNPLEIRRTP